MAKFAVPVLMFPLVLTLFDELGFAMLVATSGSVLVVTLPVALTILVLSVAAVVAPIVFAGLRLLVILSVLVAGGTKVAGVLRLCPWLRFRVEPVLGSGDMADENGKVPRVSVVNPHIYDAFRKSGVPEELARVAAEAIPDRGTVATKVDIEKLRADLTLSLTGRFVAIMAVFVTAVAALLGLAVFLLRGSG